VLQVIIVWPNCDPIKLFFGNFAKFLLKIDRWGEEEVMKSSRPAADNFCKITLLFDL
jgi:hypothetical protein